MIPIVIWMTGMTLRTAATHDQGVIPNLFRDLPAFTNQSKKDFTYLEIPIYIGMTLRERSFDDQRVILIILVILVILDLFQDCFGICPHTFSIFVISVLPERSTMLLPKSANMYFKWNIICRKIPIFIGMTLRGEYEDDKNVIPNLFRDLSGYQKYFSIRFG
jgi:hypothetical protein